MIDSEQKFVQAIHSATHRMKSWSLRRRFNPHHSKSQIETEAIILNLELNDVDRQILTYASKNNVMLLISEDPVVREYTERLHPYLKGKDSSSLLSLLETEKERLNKRLKQLETEEDNYGEDDILE